MQFTKGLGQDSERVLLALRRELEQGLYPVGAKFPTALELASRFEASRNTILRALERLVADGFIESRRGAGTHVLRTGRVPTMNRMLAAMFPFDAENLIAAQNVALDRGFLMCVYSRNSEGWSPVPERAFLERVRAGRQMGLLACLTPTKPTNEDILREMANEGIRIIHLEPYELQPPEQNYLLPDYLRGGELAATTALLAGFKHLVFVGTDSDWPGALLFRRGVEDAIDAHAASRKISHEYFEFPVGTNFFPDALQCLKAFVANCKSGTALVCRDTSLGNEILTEFLALGRQPGRDFMILAPVYLNDPLKNLRFPVIDFDREAILRRAIELLTGEDWPRVKEMVRPRLISPSD